MTNNKRTLKKLLVGAAIGAGIGFGCGLLLFLTDQPLAQLLRGWEQTFLLHFDAFILPPLLLLAAAAWGLYLLARRSFPQGPVEDDATEDRVNAHISAAMLANLLCQIFCFGALGLALTSRFPTCPPFPLVVGALLIAVLLLSTWLDVLNVNLTKKLRPNLTADPGDMNFTTQYTDQLDEAEKALAHRCAFHSWVVLKYTIMVLWTLVALGGSLFKTGILPILLLTIVWAVHSLSYTYYNWKFSRKTAR